MEIGGFRLAFYPGWNVMIDCCGMFAVPGCAARTCRYSQKATRCIGLGISDSTAQSQRTKGNILLALQSEHQWRCEATNDVEVESGQVLAFFGAPLVGKLHSQGGEGGKEMYCVVCRAFDVVELGTTQPGLRPRG